MARVDVAQLVKGLKLLSDVAADVKAEDIPDSPNFWWKLTHLEPALYAGIVTAVVAVLASVGFAISDSATSSIISAVVVIVGLVQALWTRSKSTPNQKVVVYKPDPVNSPNEVSAGSAVSSNAVEVVNAAASTPDVSSELLPLIP